MPQFCPQFGIFITLLKEVYTVTQKNICPKKIFHFPNKKKYEERNVFNSELGVNPYPYSFEVTITVKILKQMKHL